jgi:hypothetical protein
MKICHHSYKISKTRSVSQRMLLRILNDAINQLRLASGIVVNICALSPTLLKFTQLKSSQLISNIFLTSQDALRNNENYRQISHMEEQLKDIMKDNKLMQEIVDELNQEFDFSHVKNVAMKKVDDYNRILCDDLKMKSQSII